MYRSSNDQWAAASYHGDEDESEAKTSCRAGDGKKKLRFKSEKTALTAMGLAITKANDDNRCAPVRVYWCSGIGGCFGYHMTHKPLG